MSATTTSRDPRSECDLLIVGGRTLDLDAESVCLMTVRSRYAMGSSWQSATGPTLTPGRSGGAPSLGSPAAGITSVVDAGSCGIEGLVSAATEVGIRAAIGPSLADLWHDEHGVLVRQADADRLLADARDAIGRHDGAGEGRIRAVVSAVESWPAPTSSSAGSPP